MSGTMHAFLLRHLINHHRNGFAVKVARNDNS